MFDKGSYKPKLRWCWSAGASGLWCCSRCVGLRLPTHVDFSTLRLNKTTPDQPMSTSPHVTFHVTSNFGVGRTVTSWRHINMGIGRGKNIQGLCWDQSSNADRGTGTQNLACQSTQVELNSQKSIHDHEIASYQRQRFEGVLTSAISAQIPLVVRALAAPPRRLISSLIGSLEVHHRKSKASFVPFPLLLPLRRPPFRARTTSQWHKRKQTQHL